MNSLEIQKNKKERYAEINNYKLLKIYTDSDSDSGLGLRIEDNNKKILNLETGEVLTLSDINVKLVGLS